MRTIKDITGMRFGLITAIEPTNERKCRRVVWRCQCDCGSVHFATSSDLLHGNVKSCGCAKAAASSKHAKDSYEATKKDMGIQDGTNISIVKGENAFSTSITGVRGVSPDGEGKYRARLKFKGKSYIRHGFKSIDDAKMERDKMYKEIVVPYLESVDRI